MASVEDVKYLSISTNCRTVGGRIGNGELADQFGTTISDIGTIEKIYIYDHDKKVQVYLTAEDWTEADGVLTFTTTSTSQFSGEVSVELHDSTDITYDAHGDGIINENDADTSLIRTIYTIAPCEIDCCMAKLVDAAIECHCKCDKCKEDLIRANKIFLMLQGARFAAEQEFNFGHAVAMYTKAKDLCVEVCACGC